LKRATSRWIAVAKNLSVPRPLSNAMMDRKIASEIELLVQGMRRVIEELSPDERKLVISSIRALSGDEVADRLEAPSGRNH
jgi:DNA-directed RNA polymerase specialized sigma24 family protein